MQIIEILICTAAALALSFFASWSVHLQSGRKKSER